MDLTFEKILVGFWKVLIGKESSADIEELEGGLINYYNGHTSNH